MDNQPVQPPQQQPVVAQPQQPVPQAPKHSKLLPVTILLALILIIGVGLGVYSWQHSKVKDSDTKIASLQSQLSNLQSRVNKLDKQTAATSTAGQQSTQKYITISTWGVRVPYSGSDTLSVSSQTCDEPGDTVLTGCSVDVNSQDLANAVGSCQSTRATGKVGYFYRMGANDNYQDTGGGGFTPVAQWTAANPGQYTKIGNYYYAFAEIGAAWGGQGANSINTSTHALADTVPAGCSDWIAEYNNVEPTVKVLASKFEAISH